MNNIIMICDSNYCIPTKAAIRSIIFNSRIDEEVTIYVLGVDLSKDLVRELESLSLNKKEVCVRNLPYPYADDNFTHSYVSVASLYKFQLADIFSDLDRALYLDCDVIVNKSLSMLFDTKIEDYYVAAVEDMPAVKSGDWANRLGHKRYFNSGVMLLNLKKLREDGISGKLIEYKKNDADNTFMDQNALNALLGNDTKWLPIEYNYLICLDKEYKEKEVCDFYNCGSGIFTRKDDIYIYHLAGSEKPWKALWADYFELWAKYADSRDILFLNKLYLQREMDDLKEKNDELENKINQLTQENKELSWRIDFCYRHTLRGLLGTVYHKIRG